MRFILYAGVSLALLGCETGVPVSTNTVDVPASGGARVMAIRPVETRGEVLSAGPGAAFELADLFIDDADCYYARIEGRLALLTDASGAQMCEQAGANPVFVAPQL